jgi:hypothetical protein
MTTKCPICHESVAATRFAIHLEKCMNGGKRGSKRHYDYIRDDVYLNKTTKPKKEIIDPHPDSFIVKVKLRNGGEHKYFFSFHTFNLIIPFPPR